jgi:hypothetical protein
MSAESCLCHKLIWKFLIAHSTKSPLSLLENLARTPDPTSENSRRPLQRMHLKRIIGLSPTLEDLVDPIEERKVSDSPFEGGDAEIVAEVLHEMAVAQGEVIELDDSDNHCSASGR